MRGKGGDEVSHARPRHPDQHRGIAIDALSSYGVASPPTAGQRWRRRLRRYGVTGTAARLPRKGGTDIGRGAAAAKVDGDLPRLRLTSRSWANRDSRGNLGDGLDSKFNDGQLGSEAAPGYVDTGAPTVLHSASSDPDGFGVEDGITVAVSAAWLAPNRATALVDLVATFAGHAAAATGASTLVGPLSDERTTAASHLLRHRDRPPAWLVRASRALNAGPLRAVKARDSHCIFHCDLRGGAQDGKARTNGPFQPLRPLVFWGNGPCRTVAPRGGEVARSRETAVDAQSESSSRLRLPVALLAAAAVLAAALGAGLWSVGSGLAARATNEVTVTGSARSAVRSDRAVWTISASHQALDITTAIDQTNSSLNVVTRYLTDGGIDPADITLDALATNVNYEWVDGNLTSNITSYGAYRNVTVRTADVDLVARLSAGLGDILSTDVVVSAFAPEYYVTTLPELRPALLAEAVADAQARAESMLAITEGTVGPVRAMRSGPFQVSSPDSVDVSDGGIYDTSTIEKTVTATVSVTFSAR